MIPQVLARLDALRADLATVDPIGEHDAADRIAAMAVALRDLLATGLGEHTETPAATAAVLG